MGSKKWCWGGEYLFARLVTSIYGINLHTKTWTPGVWLFIVALGAGSTVLPHWLVRWPKTEVRLAKWPGLTSFREHYDHQSRFAKNFCRFVLASQECVLTSFQHIEHIVDLGTHINILFMSHENRQLPGKAMFWNTVYLNWWSWVCPWNPPSVCRDKLPVGG